MRIPVWTSHPFQTAKFLVCIQLIVILVLFLLCVRLSLLVASRSLASGLLVA